MAGCTVVTPINNTDYAVCYKYFPYAPDECPYSSLCSVTELNVLAN